VTVPARPLLTDAQLDVLRLVANGNGRTATARLLHIGLGTVHNRLTAAYRALGVHHEAHAVAVALRLGLIRLDDIVVPSSAGTPGASASDAA
jgi:DNA-binding CsgD family transcriptional regulator